MKRILVVDDDSSILQLLRRALVDYDVTVARDGFEALAAAQQMGSVDLLITDYLMPSMIGDELIARVRKHQPHLQVLVVTGHHDILEREAAEWWKASAHLPKPFLPKTLREQVDVLTGRAADRAIPSC